MKKRIMLLLTLAAMLATAMALSGVAQAAPVGGPADAQCAKLAMQTFGPSYNPSNYTFIGGTEGPNDFTGRATDRPDVFCGFGGDDLISTLDEGDIFLGGEGNDSVYNNDGIFNGGPGDIDSVVTNNGTFNGGEGFDSVSTNSVTGTVNGEAGNDSVYNNDGIFNGGPGGDFVHDNNGTFNGGEGNDLVDTNLSGGTFNGGEGDDRVVTNTGTIINVERVGSL